MLIMLTSRVATYQVYLGVARKHLGPKGEHSGGVSPAILACLLNCRLLHAGRILTCLLSRLQKAGMCKACFQQCFDYTRPWLFRNWASIDQYPCGTQCNMLSLMRFVELLASSVIALLRDSYAPLVSASVWLMAPVDDLLLLPHHS